MLPKDQVLTKEVLEWKGVHLFYGELSLCSRKVQIFLGLKSVKFTPHVIDLKSFEVLIPSTVPR